MDEKHIEEAPLLKVARLLREQGFDLANCAGYALRQEDIKAGNSLGILKKTETKRFLFFISLKSRRKHIGNIWFREHGANDKQWVLEIFGRDNVPTLQPVAVLISQTYSMVVKIKLVSEVARKERFLRDGDF